MEGIISKIADAIGVHADLSRIAVCIFGSFPMCSILKRIPNSHMVWKQLLILAVGIFYLVGMFQLYTGTLSLFACSSFTYLFASVASKNPQMPKYNFYIQMGMMLYTHCLEQFGGGDFVNNIGISGSQMILSQKLTAYAWDIHDGTRPPEKSSAHQQKSRLIDSVPFLAFISWAFFFPTILTGPSCTYTEYIEWLDGTIYKDSKDTRGHVSKRQPRGGTVLLFKLLEGIFWVTVYTQVSWSSNDLEFFKREWYVRSDFSKRVAAVYVSGVAYRTKYYSAWIMSEAVCIHSGSSFNGINPHTGKSKWDRMRNVVPFSVETAQNFYAVFGNWNIITARWSKEYVYVRVTPEGQKAGTRSTIITFLTSATWHGTRPGYYSTFALGALYQIFGKVYRRNSRPVFVHSPKKYAYDMVSSVVTQLALSFAVSPFISSNVTPTSQAWSTLYFYPLVGSALSWSLLLGPLSPYVRPKSRMSSRDLKKAE